MKNHPYPHHTAQCPQVQKARRATKFVLDPPAGTVYSQRPRSPALHHRVIQDTDTLARLSILNAKIMRPTSDPMYGAPTAHS